MSNCYSQYFSIYSVSYWFLLNQNDELQKTVDSIVDNAQALNIVPERQQYPIGIIYMYVSLVLTASTSLRGASEALEVFLSTLNLFNAKLALWSFVASSAWIKQTESS